MSHSLCSLIATSQGDDPVKRLIGLCEGAETLSIAIGYLFVDGLAPLIPSLQKLHKVQLLVGNVVNRLTEEQIHEAQLIRGESVGPDDMFAKGLRDERNRIAAETALNLRRTIESMPQTNANRSLIIDLATLIAQGTVQVRLLTTRRLHAKTALVTYPSWHEHFPGAGIVGSSNLTFSASRSTRQGLDTPSADLDIYVDGIQNVNYLRDWFGAHWAEAQDFQKELFEELGQAWPLQKAESPPAEPTVPQ